MRLYLAGPMRNRKLQNFPEFFRVARLLRCMGHWVENPAERDMIEGLDPGDPDLEGQGFSVEAAFRYDFQAITNLEAVAFLAGWQESEGALAERLVALRCGIPCYDVVETTGGGIVLQPQPKLRVESLVFVEVDE